MKKCETARSEDWLSWPEIATPQTKSTEQMKIIWFDSVRCVAKICLIRINYMFLRPKIWHYNETTKLRQSEHCTMSCETHLHCYGQGKLLRYRTAQNAKKRRKALKRTALSADQNKTEHCVQRNCGVKYGWIMVECTENKSDENTLMKMKKIQWDAKEGAKNDIKN